MTLAWPQGISGPLGEPELRRFFDDGVVILRRVFDRVEVGMMRRAFDRLARMAAVLPGTGMHRGAQFVLGDRGDGSGLGDSIQRVVWAPAADAVLDRLGRDKRLLRIAAQVLCSRDMEQLISQAHFKMPGDGVSFDWHQDSRHRRYGTPQWQDTNGVGSFVEIVTAVDPMGPHNGGLRYIPGSGCRGHLPTDSTDAFAPGVVDESLAVDVVLEPGDVAFFGPYVIHGSLENRSAQPRRAFLNGFASPGANHRAYPGEGSGRALRL